MLLPICQAPGAAHWCRGVLSLGKVPLQGHDSWSVRTAEAIASLIQGTLPFCWRAPLPHQGCCGLQPIWLTYPAVIYLNSRISPWHPSSCFRCGKSHRSLFFILDPWVCLAFCGTEQEMIHESSLLLWALLHLQWFAFVPLLAPLSHSFRPSLRRNQ